MELQQRSHLRICRKGCALQDSDKRTFRCASSLNLKATLTFRKGSVKQRSKGCHVRLLSRKVSGIFNVLKAKPMRLFEEVMAEQYVSGECECFGSARNQLELLFAIVSGETIESH